jgi:hypothetical protein
MRMGFETTIADKLRHYEAKPPRYVWRNIQHALIKDDPEVIVPFLTITERKYVAFGAVVISLVCMSLMIFFENRPIKQSLAIEYTRPAGKKTQIESLHIGQQNLRTYNVIAETSIATRKGPNRNKGLNSKLPLQVQEFVEIYSKEKWLEQEVAQLEKKLEVNQQKQWAIVEELLGSTQIQLPKNETVAYHLSAESAEHIPVFTGKYIVEEPKPEDDQIQKKKFSKGVYITPYFGGNFTQVHYQGTPNSPYFTDKATFTGKIGYNFGAQVGYQFTPNWSIESGLGFGQYIQSFKENNQTMNRKGLMYIDQIDIPLMARFSILFGNEEFPKTFSFKSGLLYNSVLKYQVNYTDFDRSGVIENAFQIEADKRQYNSLQMGYLLGFDFDAFISRSVSLNLSMLNSFASQLENFPLFSSDTRRPLQYSNTFTIGTKIRF